MILTAQIIGSMALIYLGTLLVAGMMWSRKCDIGNNPTAQGENK